MIEPVEKKYSCSINPLPDVKRTTKTSIEIIPGKINQLNFRLNEKKRKRCLETTNIQLFQPRLEKNS